MRTYYIGQGTLLTACGDLNGNEIQKRGDSFIHMTDSLCCSADSDIVV